MQVLSDGPWATWTPPLAIATGQEKTAPRSAVSGTAAVRDRIGT